MSLMKMAYRTQGKHIRRNIALGIIGCICTAGSVRMLQLVLDGLTQGSVRWAELAIYALLLLEPYVGAYLQNHPQQSLSHGLYFELKCAALEKMRTVSYQTWQRFGTGALIQRIEAGADAGRQMCCDFIVPLISGMVPQIVITCVFIAMMDRQVFMWVLVGYAVVFVITNLLLKALYGVKQRILANEELFNHRLVRGFMELVVFRMNRRYSEEIRKAREEAGKVIGSRVEMVMIHEAFFALFVVLVGLLKIGVLAYAVATGNLSVGVVVALMSYLDSAYQPVAVFNVCYVQYKLNRIAYARFEEFLNADDTPNMLSGENALLADGSICFENVKCEYDGRCVYSGLDIRIDNGMVVGIAGESGAGKSSLVRQITGLVPVSSGRLTVGGADISKVNLDSYYRNIIYIPQETPVFDATLRENVVFGEAIPDERVLEALEAVELSELLGSLPEGLDTRIGEKGVSLSGGERQRLALARLWFADSAKLVVLDEATSAIDNVTEEKVVGRMLDRLRGKTVIMIAHRIETLRSTDSIILMKNGEVVDRGSYPELMENSRYFNELVNAQKLREVG